MRRGCTPVLWSRVPGRVDATSRVQRTRAAAATEPSPVLVNPVWEPRGGSRGSHLSAGEPGEAQSFRAPPGQGWREAGLELSSPSPAPRKGQVGEYLSAAVAEKAFLRCWRPLLGLPGGQGGWQASYAGNDVPTAQTCKQLQAVGSVGNKPAQA